MAKNTYTAYVDRLTGKTVSKKFWQSKKGRTAKYLGGFKKRYVAQTRKHYYKPRVKEPITASPIVHEWIASLSYKKSGRSFDVILTATNRERAKDVLDQFLDSDIQGKRVYRSGYSGWELTFAKGKVANEGEGEAEYRSKSRQ